MPIEIDQIIRTKRKTIALIIRPDGSLLVRAPLRASNKSIQEFVSKNAQWIEKTRARIKTVAPPPPKQYVQGEKFGYLGNFYPLEIVPQQTKSLVVEDGKFMLAAAAQGKAAIVFERWYKEQARQIINRWVEFHASQNGFLRAEAAAGAARLDPGASLPEVPARER